MTPQQAFEKARRQSDVDAAAMILTVAHVAAQLRDLAETAVYADPRAIASRAEGLAGQLHAGLVERLELSALDRFAATLDGLTADAKNGGAL